jgi:hypothetical protein
MIIPAKGLYVWNLLEIVPKDPDDQYATFSKPNDGLYIYPLHFSNIYINNLREKSVNIYLFDKSSGELKISMSKSHLENLVSEIGDIPKSGERIILVNPPTIFAKEPHIYFDNVKSISQLDSIDGKYALNYIVDIKNKPLNFVLNTYRKQENKN